MDITTFLYMYVIYFYHIYLPPLYFLDCLQHPVISFLFQSTEFINWIFRAHSLWKDTLLSQVMGERRAWSCLNLIHKNLLTPHRVLSDEWMGRRVRLGWRVCGRREGSRNCGLYVKWKKNYIYKKLKRLLIIWWIWSVFFSARVSLFCASFLGIFFSR